MRHDERKEEDRNEYRSLVWADDFTTSGEKEDCNLYISIIISRKEKNTSSHYFVSPTRNIVSLSFFLLLVSHASLASPSSFFSDHRNRERTGILQMMIISLVVREKRRRTDDDDCRCWSSSVASFLPDKRVRGGMGRETSRHDRQ